MELKNSFNKKVIIFDGDCNFCNTSVNFILKNDKAKKFLFASLYSKFYKELAELNGLPLKEINTFMYLDGKILYMKSTGALKVLTELGGIFSFAYLFILIPTFIRDLVYETIAKYRKRIIRKKVCILPDNDQKALFLE